MYLIPITPLTLDLIEVLNDGIRPAIEQEETFFMWNNSVDEPPEIITKDEATKRSEWWAIIQIGYLHRL